MPNNVRKSHVVFTSINLNYLDRALTLGSSLKRNSQNVHYCVAIIEKDRTLKNEFLQEVQSSEASLLVDEFVFLEELPIEIRKSVARLSVVEACTAVKPFITAKLMNSNKYDYITYIDPDIYVYQDITFISNKHLEDHFSSILLVPHLNNPPLSEKAVINNEISGSLKHGTYNLGFISFMNDLNSRKVVDWWSQRLLHYCITDYERGLFTDQKWFDLAIAYFPNIKIVRENGWDLASWNLDERNLYKYDHEIKLSGFENLYFYHFSKFPSAIFDSVIQNVAYPNSLQALIRDYEMIFRHYNQISINIVKNIPKHNNNQKKIIVLNIVSYLLKYKNKICRLINIIQRYPHLKKFLLRVLNRNIILRTNSNNANHDYTNLKFENLYLSHFGSGGVSEFIKNQISESDQSAWGIINPNYDNTYTLWTDLFPSEVRISNLKDIPRILFNSQNLHVHHILGWENVVHNIRQHSSIYIYLHDKYFLNKRPFSDSLHYVKLNTNIPGINQNLNSHFTMIEDDEHWQLGNIELLEKSKAIYAPSEFIKNFYSKFVSKDISIIDWEKNPLVVSYMNREINYSSKRFQEIVVVGLASAHKGLTKVIELAELLHKHDSNLKIRIFGDIDFNFKSVIEKYENVHIVGSVPRGRILYYLDSSKHTLGWIPSLTEESYNYALNDYLCTGTPIISTDAGALGERGAGISNCELYPRQLSSREIFQLMNEVILKWETKE